MWHEKEIKGGAYPYPGGWVAQPLDLLVKFQAMSLMYSYKMNRKRLGQKGVSTEERARLEEEPTDLQREINEWIESE